MALKWILSPDPVPAELVTAQPESESDQVMAKAVAERGSVAAFWGTRRSIQLELEGTVLSLLSARRIRHAPGIGFRLVEEKPVENARLLGPE